MKQLKGIVKDMKDVDLQGMKADPRNDKKVKIYTTGIRRKHFVSAEGPYSSHIFASPNNYTVLVAGRIMSDKLTKPVLWKVSLGVDTNRALPTHGVALPTYWQYVVYYLQRIVETFCVASHFNFISLFSWVVIIVGWAAAKMQL